MIENKCALPCFFKDISENTCFLLIYISVVGFLFLTTTKMGRRSTVGKCTGEKWSKMVILTILVKMAFFRDQNINANFFWTKFFENPSGHGRPHQKSWTSAPKSVFSCGPGGGEKLFDSWATGRKGQECPQEIRTKKFMFMLIFLLWLFQTGFWYSRDWSILVHFRTILVHLSWKP